MTQETTRSWFLRFDPRQGGPLGRRVVRIWSRKQGGDVRQGQVRDGVREEGPLEPRQRVRLKVELPEFRASRRACESITVHERACRYK